MAQAVSRRLAVMDQAVSRQLAVPWVKRLVASWPCHGSGVTRWLAVP